MRRSVGTLAALLLGACGTFGTAGEGADAAAPDGATAADASTGVEGGDGGTSSGDASADASERRCPRGELLCRATDTCVTSCVGCTAAPIECVRCDATQANPVGTCEPAGSAFCLNNAYAPGAHCDCSGGNVANCPAPSQVCVKVGSTDWCVTCGELGIESDTLACRGGGTCATSTSPPRCK